jgi:Tol biopolymer transport system component
MSEPRRRSETWRWFFGSVLFLLTASVEVGVAWSAELIEPLHGVPQKIIYEKLVDGSWDLFLCDADGGHSLNLTKTTDVDELYPHVSPDGKRICCVVDEGKGATKVRNVYLLNIDGTDRKLVARNAREGCWKGDGTAIAYLKGESDRFTYTDYATKGIAIYDLATGRHTEHPNKKLHHLYNLCWSPDGLWFVATVHAGMGHGHAILALEADGTKVFDLGIPGCRPDISGDGKRIAWGPSDYALRVGNLDFSGPQPKVTGARDVVTSLKPIKVYHIDWSPDGKYVAFASGPIQKRLGPHCEMVGVRADGWNICIADAAQTDRWTAITDDGKGNKEPDWVPVAETAE